MLERIIAAEDPGDSSSLPGRLLVAVAGPTVAAVLGTFLVSLVVWRIQYHRTLADRKIEESRAQAERDLDRLPNERELRHQLMTAAIATAARLYLATQHYWRQLERQKTDKTVDLLPALKILQDRYFGSRTAGEVLEKRLAALFVEPRIADDFHAVMDLLTVRYFVLTKEESIPPYLENSINYRGKKHSGLTIEELADQALLLRTYHGTLAKTTEGILAGALREVRTTPSGNPSLPPPPPPERKGWRRLSPALEAESTP